MVWFDLHIQANTDWASNKIAGFLLNMLQIQQKYILFQENIV